MFASRRVLAIGFVLLSVPGCLQLGLDGSGSGGSSGGSTSNDDDDDDPDVEEGSCNAWKVSYCNAIDECGAFESRDECEIDVGYVRCLEDAPFGACQEQIDEALDDGECKELPDDCGPEEIADRAEPYLACDRIYDAICEWSFFCGNELSVESCRGALDTSAPCTDFIAVLPDVDPCVDAYRTLGCFDASPDVCYGILRD